MLPVYTVHIQGHPFSRSYGVILPSSLAGVLSSALGCSPRLPVLVCGTDSQKISLRGFSWQFGISHFMPYGSCSPLGVMKVRICLYLPPTGLNRDFQSPDGLPCCVPPSLKRFPRRCRNINLLPIDYAFRPRLRDRLTQGRLALPWKPWAYGEQVSHLFYRYSCQHHLFSSVHRTSRFDFGPKRTLPYPRHSTS